MNTMVLPCYMSKIAQYDQKNGNTMIYSWWLTVAMLKMLSGVVLLLASSVTQPKSEAMSLSQLMVSSVWRCTMPSTSSYCWLDASNSWEASSNSMCSSLTFGHSVNQTISTWNDQCHWQEFSKRKVHSKIYSISCCSKPVWIQFFHGT